jgi:hypothetical protein
MQVTKILRVESPVHLWTLLKNSEEIFESKNELIYFLDCVDTYVNGCKCDEDLNYDNMILAYSDIKNNSDLIVYLTNSFECDEIRFLK